jgi:ubiquinone/menaquinone biosynthesis C-methylase UbiE
MIKIAKRLVSRIRNARNTWMLRGGYDPVRYWRIRGRRYFAVHGQMSQIERDSFDAQEAAWREQLRLMPVESVLELGCGYGRMLQLAQESGINELSGLDISTHQLRNAQELVPSAELQVHDIQTPLPFGDDSFDLVYTSEVLMHIPDAAPTIREMLRVARKYVAHVENPGSDTNSPWEFSHDFDSLYRSHDFRPETTSVGLQRIFVVNLEHQASTITEQQE